MAKSGNMGGGSTHVHMQAHFAPTVHALDSEGVDRVLENIKTSSNSTFNAR